MICFNKMNYIGQIFRLEEKPIFSYPGQKQPVLGQASIQYLHKGKFCLHQYTLRFLQSIRKEITRSMRRFLHTLDLMNLNRLRDHTAESFHGLSWQDDFILIGGSGFVVVDFLLLGIEKIFLFLFSLLFFLDLFLQTLLIRKADLHAISDLS